MVLIGDTYSLMHHQVLTLAVKNDCLASAFVMSPRCLHCSSS